MTNRSASFVCEQEVVGVDLADAVVVGGQVHVKCDERFGMVVADGWKGREFAGKHVGI